MVERIVLLKRELEWISLNSLWVHKSVGWSVGMMLVGEMV